MRAGRLFLLLHSQYMGNHHAGKDVIIIENQTEFEDRLS